MDVIDSDGPERGRPSPPGTRSGRFPWRRRTSCPRSQPMAVVTHPFESHSTMVCKTRARKVGISGAKDDNPNGRTNCSQAAWPSEQARARNGFVKTSVFRGVSRGSGLVQPADGERADASRFARRLSQGWFSRSWVGEPQPSNRNFSRTKSVRYLTVGKKPDTNDCSDRGRTCPSWLSGSVEQGPVVSRRAFDCHE